MRFKLFLFQLAFLVSALLGCGADPDLFDDELGQLEQPMGTAADFTGWDAFDPKGSRCNTYSSSEVCYLPDMGFPVNCEFGSLACRLVLADDKSELPAVGYDWPFQFTDVQTWFRSMGARQVFSWGDAPGTVRLVRDDSISGTLSSSGNIQASQVVRVDCMGDRALTELFFDDQTQVPAAYFECTSVRVRVDTGSWLGWADGWAATNTQKRKAAAMLASHIVGRLHGLGTNVYITENSLHQTLFRFTPGGSVDLIDQCRLQNIRVDNTTILGVRRQLCDIGDPIKF